MFYERVFMILSKEKVRYLVIGGIAVNLHGFDRVTGDMDIMIDFQNDNMKRFISAVKSLGYVPRVPVKIEDFANTKKRESWIKEKNMKVFTIYNPKREIEHIDIMVLNFLDFDKAYKSRKVIKRENIEISIISIDDLIKLKKIAHRKRDEIDISALKQIKSIIKNEKKQN